MTLVAVSLIVVSQLWFPRDGSGTPHKVIGLRQIGLGQWDTDVWYEWHDPQGVRHEYSKNAYLFQVHFFNPELEQQQASLDNVQRQSVWSNS